MDRDLDRKLEGLGFKVIGTGGGCTAWHKDHHGFDLFISDDASADLDNIYCSVSLFDQDGFDAMSLEVKVSELIEVITKTFHLQNFNEG